jgi:hypothetical protein
MKRTESTHFRARRTSFLVAVSGYVLLTRGGYSGMTAETSDFRHA